MRQQGPQAQGKQAQGEQAQQGAADAAHALIGGLSAPAAVLLRRAREFVREEVLPREPQVSALSAVWA